MVMMVGSALFILIELFIAAEILRILNMTYFGVNELRFLLHAKLWL